MRILRKTTAMYRLPLVRKFGMALGLMTVYYPIILFVNLRGRSLAYAWSIWPNLLTEFSIGVLTTTAWILLAEWVQIRCERWLGEDRMGFDRVLPQVAAAIVSFALGVLAVPLFQLVQAWILGDRYQPDALVTEADQYRARVTYGHFMMVALAAYLLLANSRAMRRVRRLRVDAERLEKERVMATLAALKNQVNPHFLFNSLSSLSALVRIQPEQAERYIQQLSDAYRYILDQREQDLVLLRAELSFLDAYLYLLDIRFRGKLKVAIEIDPSQRDKLRIAPLTLQLLLENAVKHNRMSEKDPLIVRIEAEEDQLVVRNKLRIRTDPDHSTGLGLQNIQSRYALLSTRPVQVQETDEEFIVTIPLLPLP